MDTQGVVRELASGIDALYLSGRLDLDGSVLEGLEKARTRAAASEGPIPYWLGGIEFGMSAHGWGRYRFRLSHQNGLIGLTASSHLPSVRVQPRAELLHGLGPQATVDACSDLFTDLGEVAWSVSRVDLFADLQGWWPTVDGRERFLCRAVTRNTFEESDALTGFQFGRRKGGGLTARIYEKSGHAAKTGAHWWKDMWGDAYSEGEPVARVEFEFGRKVLRECGMHSPDDVFADVSGLWGYGTEWLSYRDWSADATKSRWPVSSEWDAVRSVSLRDRPVTVQRITASRRAADERRIKAGLCGYLSSYAALGNLESLGETMNSTERLLRLWELDTGIPFSERVERKRQLWEWGL